MAVPRNRHSNARKNKRRSHLSKKGAFFVKCNSCSSLTLPHRVCKSCGKYKSVSLNKGELVQVEPKSGE